MTNLLLIGDTMYTLKNLRFFLISFILFCSTVLTFNVTGISLEYALIGSCLGILTISICFIFEKFLNRTKLLNFNSAVLGLFVGIFLGRSFNIIIDQVIPASLNSVILSSFIKFPFFLTGIYLGTVLTVKNAEQVYFSIPFIRLKQNKGNKKSILLSSSALSDPRVIDLFSSGIIDHVIIPKFIIEKAQSLMEDESEDQSPRKILGVYKKLQEIPNLEIEFSDLNFPEMSEEEKLSRTAKITDSKILTADASNTKEKYTSDIPMINIHSLSIALKPLMFAGEKLQITIQRYGKEPRQGVGYLEDGAMVVVNGGGDFIGEKIDATVLSVKHTSSGRIIFCNAVEKNVADQSYSNHF